MRPTCSNMLLKGAYLFMLRLERVVVANDATCFRTVLVSGCSAVCKMAQCWEVLLHIQDVGVGVHSLHAGRSQLSSVLAASLGTFSILSCDIACLLRMPCLQCIPKMACFCLQQGELSKFAPSNDDKQLLG